jgi:hypothetical protein
VESATAVRTEARAPVAPWESTTSSATSYSPAQGKITVRSDPLPEGGRGSQAAEADPATPWTLQCQEATASSSSGSRLPEPRKVRGRFEVTEEGGSMTASGKAFATQ